MPLIKDSTYTKRPFYLFNPHLETIFPSSVRRVESPAYERERIQTSDEDFLDLDWIWQGKDKLVIISHGLEGNSTRPYVRGMAKVFAEKGWDVLAWNCRTCSGEINKGRRMYHHGVSDDLKEVIDYALAKRGYAKVVLTGFSMGGSITIKYLGEYNQYLPKEVYRAVVFSVPCDLGASARELSKKGNAFYRKRFLKKLGKKIKAKALQMPDLLSASGLEELQHFKDFDNRYTAPLHGFKDAEDFYIQASANTYLPDIKIPTLLVNAKNDPMLPESCYPVEIAQNHPYVYLEMPEFGGHVGFTLPGKSGNWAEHRALEFAEQELGF